MAYFVPLQRLPLKWAIIARALTIHATKQLLGTTNWLIN